MKTKTNLKSGAQTEDDKKIFSKYFR